MARQLRLSRLFYYPLARDVPQADNDPVPRQLLALLAAGLKDEAITLELGVTLRTNRQRLVSLYEQIGVHNRFQAGVAAKERGWLQASAQRCTWPDPPHFRHEVRLLASSLSIRVALLRSQAEGHIQAALMGLSRCVPRATDTDIAIS